MKGLRIKKKCDHNDASRSAHGALKSTREHPGAPRSAQERRGAPRSAPEAPRTRTPTLRGRGGGPTTLDPGAFIYIGSKACMSLTEIN